MSQSLAQIYVHLVFSTKDRRPFLRDDELREHCHAYLVGACRNRGCPPVQIGGVEDHVHILCGLAKTMSVSELIRELKRESSKWIKTQPRGAANFQWQAGYGAFSIGASQVEDVVQYIVRQPEHHKKETFQEEFRRILKLYGVDYDEKYVWD